MIVNGTPVEEYSQNITKQNIRDAMSLDSSTGVSSELGSIDNILERVDLNTQQ